jgi:hypothetical protein
VPLTSTKADDKRIASGLKELLGKDARPDEHLTLSHSVFVGGQLDELVLCACLWARTCVYVCVRICMRVCVCVCVCVCV